MFVPSSRKQSFTSLTRRGVPKSTAMESVALVEAAVAQRLGGWIVYQAWPSFTLVSGVFGSVEEALKRGK